MHRRQLFTILLFLAIAILFLPSSAYAYLDPGTGSYVFQLLAAAIFGSLFLLKVYWKKIKAFKDSSPRTEPQKMTRNHNLVQEPGSFRDPSGFVFSRDGVIYRQINQRYQDNYDQLMGSGLYDRLVNDGFLIPHIEVSTQRRQTEDAYKIIKPMPIPFISHPYEWCFSQLKDAALLTLDIQAKALDLGMSLKDCSAYNVQFLDGKPIFIDTLSFEKHREREPWVAYRQFCQHFLAPLALIRYTDVRLHQLLRTNLDGIPLDLTSSLLPARTRFSFSLTSHIHLHAKAQKRFADSSVDPKRQSMGMLAFQGLIDSLRSGVEKLRWRPDNSEWRDYYDTSNYSAAAINDKKRLVSEMIDQVQPKPTSVWDLGANVGLFSRIASGKRISTIAFDMDPAAVEVNYLQCVEQGESNLLPLVQDLTNPSPGLGWENHERASLYARGPTDLALALAIVHHLAISNNLPLARIARLFSQICRTLIIEFVPKTDSQVQRLLSSREDIFDRYDQHHFELEFRKHYTIVRKEAIADTVRTLYLLRQAEI
jgi:hypothetical protein